MSEQSYNKTPPFVTIIRHNDILHYGVVKIKSKQYTTMYCFSKMDHQVQLKLIEYANQWWWQSNRSIPISLFMQEEMEEFEDYTHRFNTDQVVIVSGPSISLSELPTKRIKRRNITLKKKK